MFCCGFANGSVVSFFCITSWTLCLPKRMSQIDERAVCFSVLAAIFMFCVAFKTSRSVLMALEWMNASGAPHALLWVLGPANSMWLCCESFLFVKRVRFPLFGLRHKKQLNDALWCSSVSERLSDFGQDLFSVATDGTLFMVMWFWWFLLRMGKGGWVGQKKKCNKSSVALCLVWCAFMRIFRSRRGKSVDAYFTNRTF